MTDTDPRPALDRLIRDNGDDYLSLSRMLGRNSAYIQQYIKRGSPRILPERDRGILARYFGVDERVLGAPGSGQKDAFRLVPKLAVGASAGAGALNDAEMLAGKVGFDEKWLRRLGVDPAQVELIRVDGDSMLPTLADGDDIMVDKSAAVKAIKDGVHVIRMDDTLMVKRLKRGKGGRVSVLSDNPDFASWLDIAGNQISIIGRVVWVGRRL
jgi:phage repressor protein C with HTH and peptisase S24 domain